MARIKITQVRSIIKRPQNQKATMEALGLRGIGKTTEKEATPQVLGMVRTVQHLVSVEEL